MKLCIILTVFALVASIAAQPQCRQRCDAPFGPVPNTKAAGFSVTGIGATCGAIDYPLYWTSTTSTAATDSALNKINQTLALNPSINATCKVLAQKFLCSISYLSCDPTSASPTAYKPCQQMCYDLRATCGSDLDYAFVNNTVLAAYLNCEGNDTSGNPLYSSDPAQCTEQTTATTDLKCAKLAPASYCTAWDPTLPSSGEMCSPYASTSTYVKYINLSYTDTLAQAGAMYAVKPYGSLLPIGCYKALMAFICPNFFPACEQIYVPKYNQYVPAPMSPCRSICSAREEICKDFFKIITLTLPNCNTTLVGPLFTLNLKDNYGVTFPVQYPCLNTTFPPNASAPFALPPFDKCPSVLGRLSHPSEEKNDPQCKIKCPDPSYTDAEWQDLVNLIRVGASLSFVTMIALLVTYITNFDKRQFPLNIHMMEFVSCIILAFAFLLNGTNPQGKVWCTDPATYSSQKDNARCGVQGFLFIMFGLAVATWTCVIAFIMFRAIVFNIKVKDLSSNTKWFHLFGWGVPLAFAITAVAKQSIGYGAPLAWCFIQFEGFGFGANDTGISMDYWVFYIPIGVLFLIILVLFWITVGKIIQVRRLQIIKAGGNTRKVTSSRTLQAQIRVLLFILVVYIICFTIFEWRFQIEAANQKHHYDQVGYDWVICKIKLSVNLKDPGYCPTDSPPSRINYPHTAAESFLISAIGFLMAIAFGTDPSIYAHWRKMGLLFFNGEFTKLKDYVRFGKDPFEGGASATTKRSDTGTSNSSKKGNEQDSESSASHSAAPEKGSHVEDSHVDSSI